MNQSIHQKEATAELLDAVEEFRERLENMPDDEFIKARPDLVSILESFSTWLQVQSRTSAEAYKLNSEFDPSLMSNKDREAWIFELESLEFEIKCSLKTA